MRTTSESASSGSARFPGCSTSASTRLAMNRAVRTGGPTAGHLRDLDQPAAGADVHPPAGPGRDHLVRLGVATCVDDDFHAITLHTQATFERVRTLPRRQHFAPLRTPWGVTSDAALWEQA